MEEYSRKENLIFRGVPDRQSENCRELIFNIVNKEIDTYCVVMLYTEWERPGMTIVKFVDRENKEVGPGCLSKAESTERI